MARRLCAAMLAIVFAMVFSGCAGVRWSASPYVAYHGQEAAPNSYSVGFSVTFFDTFPAVPAVPNLYNNNVNVNTNVNTNVSQNQGQTQEQAQTQSQEQTQNQNQQQNDDDPPRGRGCGHGRP